MKNPNQKIYEIDCRHWLEIDYDTEYNCENECVDDYCRCGTIHNATIKEVNLHSLAQKITGIGLNTKIQERIIDLYCVERILAIKKIGVDSFNIDIDPGYYGEEIGSVKLDPSTGVEPLIKTILSTENNIADKIEFVLDLEYNDVLEKLVGKTWHVQIVHKSLIHWKEDYKNKVIKEDLTKYEKWELPRGIVLKKDGYFRLIDGYHRCLAAKKDNIKVIVGT